MSERVTYFSAISNHTVQDHSGWVFDGLKGKNAQADIRPVEVSRALPSLDSDVPEGTLIFFAQVKGDLSPAQQTFLRSSANVYPDANSYEQAKKACYQLYYTLTPEND
jgi:hypothetical protein